MPDSQSQCIPAGADPRVFWNGQYLFEDDPENAADYSKAAQEAQKAKWQKLMDDRGPRKKLPRELIARNGTKPQLYHYGIPFTDQYMFEYAKRHHLTFELSPETSKFFDGKTELDFADISLEDEEDKEFMNLLLSAGSFLARCHIETRCGLTLHVARPPPSEWDGMLSLWSNHDMDERYSKLVQTRKRFQDIVAKLKEVMYEGGQENDIEWWYEWDNPVGLLSSTT